MISKKGLEMFHNIMKEESEKIYKEALERIEKRKNHVPSAEEVVNDNYLDKKDED